MGKVTIGVLNKAIEMLNNRIAILKSNRLAAARLGAVHILVSIDKRIDVLNAKKIRF